MFRVYISGPISADNLREEEANVRKSAEMVEWCVQHGMAVYWPHGTWYVDQIIEESGREPIGYGYLDQDFEWIKYCDAVFVLPGRSKKGVALEIEFAEKCHIPVFRSCEGLLHYSQGKKIRVNDELVYYSENLGKTKCSKKDDSIFNQILSELKSLHDTKSHDYATDKDPLSNIRTAEEYGVPSWIGVQFRLDDKRSRIKNAIRSVLSGKEMVMSHESLEDSLIDRCVYSVIALQLYRETLKKENSNECG